MLLEMKEQHDQTTNQEPVSPKVRLADFIVAAYGLDVSNLHYNRLGRLTPLPPDAQELYIRLSKRVTTKPEGLMGNSATLGNEVCNNLSDKDAKQSWTFSVKTYLQEANKLEFKNDKFKIINYFRRFLVYDFTEHLSSYFFLVLAITVILILSGFIVYYIEKESLNGALSIFYYAHSIFYFSCIFVLLAYIFIWKLGVSFLEAPNKKKIFKRSVDLDEIRLWIISDSKAITNPNAEVLKIVSNSRKLLSKENQRQGIQIIDRLSSEIDKLKIKLDSLLKENERLRNHLEEKERIKKENFELNNTNKQLQQKIETISVQLEAPKDDRLTIETRNALFALIFLFCEKILVWHNEETKNVHSTYDAIRWIATQIHKSTNKKLKGSSINGILGIIERETFRVSNMRINPSIVHPSYDGSCHKKWNIPYK